MRTWRVPLTIILLLFGFFAVAQWRAGRPLRAGMQLPSQRVEQLALLLRQQEDSLRSLEGEIAQLVDRLREYEQAISAGRGAAEAMAEELAQLRLLLGLVPVEGPGVVVRLASPEVPGGVVPLVMRAADLAGLVNELWSAGAEAVAVNGVRVLATTGFRDHAGDILVGTVAMRAPFVIAAIGEPLVLDTALRLRGGFVEGLRSIGLRVTVQRQDLIRLGPQRVTPMFRHARPTTVR